MSSLTRTSPDAYTYEFNPEEWADSCFPHSLIPTTVSQCPSLHTLPPVIPPFYTRIKLGDRRANTAPNPSAPVTAPPNPLRRSSRGHASSSSSQPQTSSLGASGTRAPTETTHQLLTELGAVRFTASLTSPSDLVSAVLPSVLNRASGLQSSTAKTLLNRWHNELRNQERRVWDGQNPHVQIFHPPPYSVRLESTCSHPDYDAVELIRTLPMNEVTITGSILVPSYTALVRAFFRTSSIRVASYHVGAAVDVGSGTSDMGLLRDDGITVAEWEDYEKFVLEVKLLSPLDWVSLMTCLRDEGEGFKLLRTSNGQFATDTDLAPVWAPVLAQIVEQFQVNRSKYVILTDYDRYVLFSLVSKQEVAVSRMFFRDPHNPPPESIPNVDANVTVMEVVMALIANAKLSDEADRLWVDMNPIRAAARRRKKPYDDDNGGNNDGGRSGKKRTQSTRATTHSSTRVMTSLSIIAAPDLLHSYHQPLYRTILPTGVSQAELELPTSKEEVVETIVQLSSNSGAADSSSDSDHVPSLSWSADSDRPDLAPIDILLLEYLGHGRTFDAFAATVTARLPGGDAATVPAVVKHIELLSLESFAEARAGYPTRTHVLRAAEREARILYRLADDCPDVAPRLLGCWSSIAHHHLLFATEDCGDDIAGDLTTVDNDTKRAIVQCYDRLHTAGVVHGDVHPRHVLRDAKGRVRIVDFEGARRVDMSTPEGMAAVAEETGNVRKMLGT